MYRRQQLVMAGASWLGLAGLLVWIEPELVKNVLWPNSYLPMFLLFGLGWFWLLSATSNRWKRSLLWSSSLTGLVWLRSQQLDSPATIGLLIAFNLVWAYYWKITKADPTLIN